MKIQLETLTEKVNRSFTTMFNPRLSDLFFWHFHPEYELVYIEAEKGIRHVGEHHSNYFENDLVLIGSNIPHLNFDYGIKTEYRKVVIHLKKAFVESHFKNTPELFQIHKLFERSKHGIAFTGSEKVNFGSRLFKLEHLDPFQQYLQLLEILKALAQTDEYDLLHSQKISNQFSNREQNRIQSIYAFVDNNFQRKIDLQEVASLCNMTKEAFCRYFKKATTYTFVEFLNRYRISQSKLFLMAGRNISEACFSSGFESLSYYNRIFKKVTQENPSDFRKRYL